MSSRCTATIVHLYAGTPDDRCARRTHHPSGLCFQHRRTQHVQPKGERMPHVIDYDPLILGRPQIIGPFGSWEDADQWGRRHITTGAWHVMPLTAATDAATGSSSSGRMASATHA